MIVYRNATIELSRDDNQEREVFDLSFSSETPYRRWYGDEILGHKRTEVDMDWIKSGNAAVLENHKRNKVCPGRFCLPG